MAKFLLGVIVGVVVAVLGLVIIGFAVGRLFSNKQPVISPNAVLVLALSGEVPESSPMDFHFILGQNQATPTVRDVWTSLRAALPQAPPEHAPNARQRAIAVARSRAQEKGACVYGDLSA